jgi:hypothetical protein
MDTPRFIVEGEPKDVLARLDALVVQDNRLGANALLSTVTTRDYREHFGCGAFLLDVCCVDSA